MPYLVICPNCAAKFKTPQAVPAGRSLYCPQCKGQFTLSEPAPELPDPARPAAAPSPPPPVPPPIPPRSTIPTGRLEKDLPAAQIVDDDEDDRPRAKRPRDDEDDDRPPVRRPRYENERPRRARSAPRDDEEYNPRDEIADRPPARSRKKSNRALLIGLGAGGAALLLLLVCGGVLYWADPFGLFGGGASSEMLAWAPADSQAVIYMDVEQVERVQELKGQLAGGPTNTAQYGIRPDTVSAVLGAGRTSGMGANPDVLVVKLRSDADRSSIITANGGTKATAGGRDYYKTTTGGAVYFPSSRMVVIARNENSLTARLGKDEGKVVITDDLRAATKRGDGIVWMAASGQAAEQGDIIGLMSGLGNMAAMFGKGGGFGPGAPAMQKPPRAKSTVMSVKVSGNTGTSRIESTYESSDVASRVADGLRGSMGAMKSREPGAEYDVSSSGATVTLKMTGPIRKGPTGIFPFAP